LLSIAGLGDNATDMLPNFIKPMLAVESREPFDSDDYIFEIKWDGVRCLAFIEAGRMRLQSRELVDITPQFPELSALAELPDGTVIDGELVSMVEDRPCLAKVQRRVQLQNRTRIQMLSQSSPVVFVVFDLPYVGGASIMAEPLVERRARLEEIIRELHNAPVVVSQAVLTQGCDLFAAAARLSQEGIMAKALDGHYAPGRRTRLWRKIKVSSRGEAISACPPYCRRRKKSRLPETGSETV
jgi:ATP-dependent DNA ligase